MTVLESEYLTSPLSEALAALPIGGQPDVSISDRSLWPRLGIKGSGVRDWLADRGLRHDLATNTAAVSRDHLLVVMLAPNEALIAAPHETARDTLPGFGDGRSLAKDVWPVPRDFGAFHLRLAGRRVARGLSRICEIDFEPECFGDGEVAQTLAARVAATIVRSDRAETPAYHLFGDATFGDYLARQILGGLARGGVSVGRETQP